MKRAILVILLLWLLMVLQSTFFALVPTDILWPDLPMIAALYLGLRRRWLEGVALAAAVGYLADIFAASPYGLHTFLVALFATLVHLAADRILMRGFIMRAGLTALAFLVYYVLLALMTPFFRPTHYTPGFVFLAGHAVVNTLYAAPVFWLLGRIDELLATEERLPLAGREGIGRL